ncbi:MAG: FAD-binding protein [Deltaproteobacteria bacterium]|nr:FAD-binding protein [Deltaproteobacteria bacterium]
MVRPRAVHTPVTQKDLTEIVGKAASEGTGVRAVGGGHSWSAITQTDGELLDLSKYNQVLSIDRDSMTVTAQAGIRLRDINEQLAQAGLAFPNLGTIDHQSVAGLVSTATHGTGIKYGTLSGQVAALDIIDGRGEVIHCSPTENPDTFEAARCGLGCCGLISTVTFNVVPAFHLEAHEEVMELSDVLERLDEFVEQNDHFKFWWIPHTKFCIVMRQNRTDKPRRVDKYSRWMQQTVMRNVMLEAGLFLYSRRFRAIPKFNEMIVDFTPKQFEFVDRSDKVFLHPANVRHWECELAVPVEHGRSVIGELRQFIDNTDIQIGFIVEVRFVKGEDVWMSPAHGRDSCYIGAFQYRSMPHEQYFFGFERFASFYGARPHWGKLHNKTAADLQALYPKFDAFVAERNRLDPDGVFMNDYYAKLLTVPAQPQVDNKAASEATVDPRSAARDDMASGLRAALGGGSQG